MVAARGRDGVIGRDGALPWRLKTDLQLFKAATLGKPVLMGRRTWESLPRRPLPGRANFVLSRDGAFQPAGAVAGEDFTDLLAMAREHAADTRAGEVCVIGGEAVFALALPRANRLVLTEVDVETGGHARFPAFDETAWREVERRAYAPGEGDDHAFVHRVLERR
ncbi:MAG: dihydrofolate reductase [Caulobacteraceae bacterium]|nr:dihydrofolate reductase [Caulobacter sp.]